jgi:hypothetical protein
MIFFITQKNRHWFGTKNRFKIANRDLARSWAKVRVWIWAKSWYRRI